MEKKPMVFLFVLLLVVSVLIVVQQNSGSQSKVLLNEIAGFNRNRDLFNSKENQEKRADALAEKESAIAKKKAEELDDKGEGQFKVKF